MENESPITERTDDNVVADADQQSTEIVEELLIEEISIDGMCGVY